MSGKALKSIIIVFVLAVAAVGYWITKDHINILLNEAPSKEVVVEVNVEHETMAEAETEAKATEPMLQAEAEKAETEINNEAETAPVETTEKETETETEAEAAKTETAPVETEETTTEKETTTNSSGFDVKAAMEDRVIGDPNAPVTIHEYASMTCSHCATFYEETFPTLKKKFVDTGKIKFVFHEFPLDAYALTAAKITRCLPKDQFFNMLEVFFTNQKRWLQADDPTKALAQLGALAGMNEESFHACNDNKELEEAMMEKMKTAQEEFNIRAVPTFVFNNGDDILSGARPLPEFEMTINDFIAGQALQQGK